MRCHTAVSSKSNQKSAAARPIPPQERRAQARQANHLVLDGAQEPVVKEEEKKPKKEAPKSREDAQPGEKEQTPRWC